MDKYVCVRRYKREDEPYCKEIAKKSIMKLLNPLYYNLLITSFRFHILLAITTYKLYSSEIPYYFLYPFLITFSTYIMLRILFWKIIRDFQRDVFDAMRICYTDDKRNFWVAEEYQYRSFKSIRPYPRYRWLTEAELIQAPIFATSYNKRIVGFIGVGKNVRSGNGAMISNLIVHNDYRHKGIGSQLIKTAIDYCSAKKFVRVNVQLFDFMANPIKLFQKLNFKYFSTEKKSFFPILRDIKIYELSILTSFSRFLYRIRKPIRDRAENDLILNINNYF